MLNQSQASVSNVTGVRSLQRNTIWLIAGVAITLLSLSALAYSWSQAANPNRVASGAPERPANLTAKNGDGALPGNSSPQQDLPAIVPNLQSNKAQLASGITIQLDAVQREGDYIRADICYQLPSEADWLPGNSAGDVVLTVGDKTIPIWGFKLIDWKTSPNGKKTHRCDYLLFPVAADQDVTQFTITIKRLVTSVPEQPDCNKAQEQLVTAKTGLVIRCNHGENSFGYEVAQKPASMSDSQARDLIYEAFSEIVRGPWVFATGVK